MNPIIRMLSWKSRLLNEEDIKQILIAIANMDTQAFTLTELTELIPHEIAEDRKKRRSISTLLATLESIGYLSKPSERKWTKNAPSLSYYLSTQIVELGNIERSAASRSVERRIIDVSRR